MKRNTLFGTAMTGLVALSIGAGSMAMADSKTTENDAAELQQFTTANPQFVQVISDLEASTGGKVTGAGFEDEGADAKTLVEFEVTMADGTSTDMILNTTDGTMVADTSTDAGVNNQDGDDDDGDGDAENEADDADAPKN